MNQSLVERDRSCHKCHGVFQVSAAALREHVQACTAQAEAKLQRKTQQKLPPIARKKLSVRARVRMVSASQQEAATMKVLLLAVLAQKGGEVTVTRGTLEQITEDLNFEVVNGPEEGTDRIVRIVK